MSGPRFKDALKGGEAWRKDHNDDNNPADGSNWELLCMYCHDEEHSRFENLVRYGETGQSKRAPVMYNPFAGLKDKLAGKERNSVRRTRS